LPALGPLDLEVADGEFVAVLGPSGCGKSTLLKVLSGLLAPSAGDARLDGQPIDRPRKDVGIVFQQPTLLPWKTVRENVLMPIRVLGIYSADYRRRADELIEMVGLGQFAEHYPHELSGGMQQRVAIARGLIHEPKLLLMDEPFAALDAQTRELMQAELLRIWNEASKTVLFITHQIDEAIYLSDRVLVMSARPGRILADITIDLPRPRQLEIKRTPEFITYADQIWGLIAKQLKPHIHDKAAHPGGEAVA